MRRLKPRVLLVNPSKGRTSRFSFSLPPLSLALLATYLPREDCEIIIHDESVSGKLTLNSIVKIAPDIVAITVLTGNAWRAYSLAEQIMRHLEAKVVLGGWHVTACPDEALEYADVVVTGEADERLPQIIEEILKGKERYDCGRMPDLSDLPFPRWDLVDFSRYTPGGKFLSFLFPKIVSLCPVPVQTGRGCIYNCDYCAVKGKHIVRPVEEVLEEIKWNFRNGRRVIGFVDDLFLSAVEGSFRERIKQILQGIPKGVRWLAQATMNIGGDDELLRLAQKSGCFALYLGAESISEASLKSVGKTINKPSQYRDWIENIRKHRIRAILSFMIGLPGDQPGVGLRNAQFALESGAEGAVFYPFFPLPDTKSYDEMRRNGQLIKENYWMPRIPRRGVFHHPSLSPEEIFEEAREAYRLFYNNSPILKRAAEGSFWESPISLLFNFSLKKLHQRYFEKRSFP